MDFERRVGVEPRALLNLEDEKETDREDSGAEQDEVHRAEGRREENHEPGAHHAPDRRARPDEAEDPLRLARVVDVVRERPELADQEEPEKEAPEEEKRGRDQLLHRPRFFHCGKTRNEGYGREDPWLVELEEKPETDEDRNEHELGARQHPELSEVCPRRGRSSSG